ncbi:hypothetical protein L5F09_08015 [Aliarcobacter butzleri]|uniref:hypothetical protein n=1 Tax=Aliarcobacter butzleri TaxID=28197 RepID=UPI001EDC1FA6|nr:hypothetical protein [Aliarcobacter butzleri]MCG3665690.1 hypothetical protein [Aliarcobacter butzleri]
MVKNFLKGILKNGLFSFPLDYIKLSTLNRLETKKTKYINSLLLGYYKQKAKNITIDCNISSKQKGRVFFLMNIQPLWEKSTSNFLKIIADIAKYYLENGIEVHFVLGNHSHVSYLTNNGIKWKNFMIVESNDLKNKIEEDLYNMNQINKDEVQIHILNQDKGKILLKEYFNSVVKFFNNCQFNKNDLIFQEGGKIKSFLFEELMGKICAKKVHLTMGRTEFVNSKKYDYVYAFNTDLKENEIKPIITNLSPFYWETLSSVKLSDGEESFLKSLENKFFQCLFISAKQKIASSIDAEFIEIMNEINRKYNNIHFCLIGDTKQSIEKKLKDKITFDFRQISVVEFSESLYNFYKRINEKVNTLFIFPRISGGGTGNLTVANAGIPTTIFKGNDAEGSWLPAKYFVDTKDNFLNQIDKFVKNKNNEKERFLKDFTEHKEKIENESKEMCRRLLYADK